MSTAFARLPNPSAWRAVPLLALGWLAGPAHAQDVDASQMVRGGLQVVQMIDQGRLGELWDGAAAGARKRVTREEFVLQVSQARAPLGAAQARTWVSVNRVAVDGAGASANADADVAIAGQYVNVEHETRFASQAPKTVRELTTFHLGNDGVWRFSGYFIR